MSLSKRPVTLEDLLRLKRAERPPVEFWEQFDRELRAKQLAALVEKRPWWRGMPSLFAGIRRYQLPLGATAVLALTFVTLREYQPAGNSAAPQPAIELAPAPADLPAASAPVIDLATPSAAAVPSDTTLVASDNDAPSADTLADTTPSPMDANQVMPMIPLLGSGAQPVEGSGGITPSARAIAANLAAAQASAPAATRALLGLTRGFEARAVPTRTPTEPLAQMTTPSEVRRSRWLSAMATPAVFDGSQVRTGDRVASRISEDRLYDEVHRFGARGDRFSVRF